MCLSAECVAVAFLSPLVALLSTRDGALYLLRLLTAPHSPGVREEKGGPSIFAMTFLRARRAGGDGLAHRAYKRPQRAGGDGFSSRSPSGSARRRGAAGSGCTRGSGRPVDVWFADAGVPLLHPFKCIKCQTPPPPMQSSPVSNAVLSLYALEDAQRGGLPSNLPAEATAAVSSAPAATAASAAMAEEEDDAFLYGGGSSATAPAPALPTPAVPAGSKRSRVDAFGAEAAAPEQAEADVSADEPPPPSSPQQLEQQPLPLRRPFRLFPVDALISAAPASDAVIGRCGGFLDEAGAGVPPSAAPVSELATTCGLGHTGGLVLVSSAFHAQKCAGVTTVAPLRLPDAFEGAWYLPLPGTAGAASGGGFVLLGTRTGQTRALAVNHDTGALTQALGGEDGVGFVLDGRTLAAGALLSAGVWHPPPAADDVESDAAAATAQEARWRQHDGSNARLVQVVIRRGVGEVSQSGHPSPAPPSSAGARLRRARRCGGRLCRRCARGRRFICL